MYNRALSLKFFFFKSIHLALTESRHLSLWKRAVGQQHWQQSCNSEASKKYEIAERWTMNHFWDTHISQPQKTNESTFVNLKKKFYQSADSFFESRTITSKLIFLTMCVECYIRWTPEHTNCQRQSNSMSVLFHCNTISIFNMLHNLRLWTYGFSHKCTRC